MTSKQTETIRTRFAPSPTGYLHIGGLRTALYSYLYASKVKGKFILRIEDTDLERYVEGAVEVIIDTLHKAGITYDEGPIIGGDYGPYVQSERKNLYMQYALQLVEQGDAYYCFCTKDRLDSTPDLDGARKYDKHCLNLSKAQIAENLQAKLPFVIRQNMPLTGTTSFEDVVFGTITVENKELEDNILIKTDGMPTYNFANVIDDHLMAINCVMRGTEYLSSTPKYNHLYNAFKWQIPTYVHMPPIMKDAQHKLSKRNGDASFDDLIKKGFLKDAIVNYIALLGWSPKTNQEKMTFTELKESFSLEGLSRSPAIFDELKLRWLNGLYIKELPLAEFVKIATPYINQSKATKYDYTKICKLLQGRIETLADIAEKINFIDEFVDYDLKLFEHQKLKTTIDTARQFLPSIISALSAVDTWTEENIHTALINLVATFAVKNGIILWPTRVALSGKESTPGGATELADLLGKEESIRRLNYSLALLNRPN